MTSRIEEIYGSMVFNDRVMKEKLPKDTYRSLQSTIKEGTPLNIEVANVVAHAMKEWAIEHGATHYTHWFQPLTGITSEKHDSFLEPDGDGMAITKFSGKELIQGEPDASSFPSGGLRATFEARGYTAWDPTSYAFIKDEVLCIPTAFCSYTGEALDKKTPLLRSMSVISDQANRVLAHFGEDGHRVVTTVGAEQEYFLISEKDYEARQDLMVAGRTLFGAPPVKGQEMEDHYFGAIRPTVNNFMKEVDDELWKLGVPAKTKHNEVAPCQHELAPVFENSNAAIDHNLLTMEEMKLLASHHGLVCLQHEKPFEGINGSGKHNNWALSTGKTNLLDPGENPAENLRFLIFLTCVIECVDDYQELLRMSVASAGNDHRLGANEAPPAIISIFLGTELSGIVDAIIEGHAYENAERAVMDLGVDVLPNFLKDNTDRNRTSPFAFTGNKFEFRMPGSQVNLSDCNMILNTAMAHALKKFADATEGLEGEEFEKAALKYIKDDLTAHQRIIYDGNGYGEEWPIEAEKRGLANHKNTAEALPCLVDQKTFDLFEEFGVLTEAEVRSRYEVKLDKYTKTLNIECNLMERMAHRNYVPAISAYATKVAKGITTIREAMPDADLSDQHQSLTVLLDGIKKINAALRALQAEHTAAEAIADSQQQANAYAEKVVPAMQNLRDAVDAMESVTDHGYWPVPTYNDILFYA
ncbi:MAG: glutamine synthetase III [Eggerthellaceae bacterium]|jgi:glutamine synthetase|nr:glutamine synthetase III [Eggerthellaceae bacterium]